MIDVIKLGAISEEVLMNFICNMCSEIALFKLVVVLLKHAQFLHSNYNR